MSLDLTVVDTPGFGNAVDNQNCWNPLVKDIDSAFGAFLDAESMVERTKWKDTRVHCCLYFIAPTGHGYVVGATVEGDFTIAFTGVQEEM